MLTARFISKGIGDPAKVEAAINHRLDVGSIDCPHEIHLMAAAADDQSLQPGLFSHLLSGCDFPGAAS